VYSVVLPLESTGKKLVLVEGLTSESEAVEVGEWIDNGRGRLQIECTFHTSPRRIALDTPAAQAPSGGDEEDWAVSDGARGGQQG
jgi:hypothetical protein